MAELAKALGSASLAVGAFGMQQMANLLARNRATKSKAAYYSVTNAAQQEFATSPLLYAIDQLGSELQQKTVDALWDVVCLKPLDPFWLGRLNGSLLQGAVDAAVALAPPENLSATWRQLRNTFAVIGLINEATVRLDLPPGPVNLSQAVDRAYAAGGDYAVVWLVEGLGEEYTRRNWPSARRSVGLLTSARAADVPQKALLMMHAGMGIAFARRIINPLTPYTQAAQIGSAIEEFLGLVKANARPGYEGPALESLGLVTRTWYPQMTAMIDRCLWPIDVEALEYFWHGVGRAAYFAPRYQLPGATAFQGVAAIAPHRLARLNAGAGAAWAFTLVNLRQPEVLLNLLANHGGELGCDDSFSNGVGSTVMMALETIPGDPAAMNLTGYHPQSAPSQLANLWDRLVRIPSSRAVTRYLPILKASQRLGEIFRYQDLERLASDLEERG